MKPGGTDVEENCCCSGKTTQRTPEARKALLNRLRRIEGQVQGVRRMMENDAWCNDVLVQSAAVAAALNAFNRELLRAHIAGCVVSDIRAGRDETVQELIRTVELLMR